VHIGATPQFKDQIDPTIVTFHPDPALVALGRQVFLIRIFPSLAVRHVLAAMIRRVRFHPP